MFEKILVGVDGSERQASVLKHASELASKHGAKLTLCRAVQLPRSIPSIAWTLQGDAFEEFLLGHSREQLQGMAESLPAGVVEGITVELGQPADLICKLVETRGIDLVMIGSHGYHGLDRVLGTTAGKVVNRAQCSVMVVRSDESRPSSRGS